MKFSCNKCELTLEIEKNKKMLNDMILEKNQNLLDAEIIKLSQLLDNLIYSCVSCEKKLNYISNSNSNSDLKDIFGIHSAFYYYGKEHLFVNMYHYIKQGIINNEFIYVSMQENLYNELLDYLKINNVDTDYIAFRAVEELIMSNKYGGLSKLKEKIDSISLEERLKKYNGVRWIGQPTYAIKSTSREDFLNWEVNLNEALNNKNISLLCIYDAYDYLNEGNIINEEVIAKSLNTHAFILKNLMLESIVG